MPLDYHRLAIGEGLKAKRLDGTELGFLVIYREMCWNCYGEGRDLEANAQTCPPCSGSGFIERNHSLAMALAAMNLATPAEPDIHWVSYSVDGVRNAGNEYDGVRVFAACPPEATSSEVPYALIVHMRMPNSMPSPFTTTPNLASPWPGRLPPSYSSPRARSTSKRIGLPSSTLLHLELETAGRTNTFRQG